MKINLCWKNIFILICVVFTVLTVISSSWALITGDSTDTHIHILLRFVITFIGISSIMIFKFISQRWLSIIVHYGVTVGFILLLTRISGSFLSLHPDAYRDIFLNFTVIYILIAGGFLLINKVKKSRNKK